MVANQAGHGGFKAKLLYWGHNRVGYVRVLDAEQIAAGVQPDNGRVSHNQVQRISLPSKDLTANELSDLAVKLDLPYGVKQLRFETPRTRAVLESRGLLVNSETL